jgi:hypothetical protein
MEAVQDSVHAPVHQSGETHGSSTVDYRDNIPIVQAADIEHVLTFGRRTRATKSNVDRHHLVLMARNSTSGGDSRVASRECHRITNPVVSKIETDYDPIPRQLIPIEFYL